MQWKFLQIQKSPLAFSVKELPTFLIVPSFWDFSHVPLLNESQHYSVPLKKEESNYYTTTDEWAYSNPSVLKMLLNFWLLYDFLINCVFTEMLVLKLKG